MRLEPAKSSLSLLGLQEAGVRERSSEEESLTKKEDET